MAAKPLFDDDERIRKGKLIREGIEHEKSLSLTLNNEVLKSF